jgi:5S rRNA maturation endonuclease (ribonuclease M5)
MSGSQERKMEEMQHIIENLIAEATNGTPIIVEGLRDRESLERLEVKGDVITVKTSGKTLLDTLQEIEDRNKDEVILLMDFDRRGKEMTAHLIKNLEKSRIKTNLVFWKKLSSLVGRDVKDIEGLATYIKTLNKKIGKDASNPGL